MVVIIITIAGENGAVVNVAIEPIKATGNVNARGRKATHFPVYHDQTES